MIKKLKRQKQKQEVDKIRLENLLIAQKEIEAGRKCTIMGRTFTKRDLEYIKSMIIRIKQEV